MPITALAADPDGAGMRMVQRSRVQVEILPRQEISEQDGGCREGFAREGTRHWASVGFVANTLGSNVNGLISTPMGLRTAGVRKIRIPGAVSARPGDGVRRVGQEEIWRIVEVCRYPSLTVLRAEEAMTE
ncbi:MAG: hypothetical protein Q4C31_08275 [Eubacteriales bacterium]|nr:hypothetical protein [Eubacteriales bacterium]